MSSIQQKIRALTAYNQSIVKILNNNCLFYQPISRYLWKLGTDGCGRQGVGSKLNVSANGLNACMIP